MSSRSGKYWFVLPLIALASTTATPACAEAQTFRGMVVDDSTKRPLESATITLLDSKGNPVARPPVRSDSLGRFVIHAPDPGKFSLRATRIGYTALSSNTVTFNGGEAVNITLAMSVAGQRLGTVVVAGKRRLNGYELLSDLGFDLRRSKGNGQFLDTLDLKSYDNALAYEILQAHAGLFLWERQIGPTNSLQMINGMRAGSTGFCSPSVFVDGFDAGAWRLETLSADAIYGIEVYNHYQLPPVSIAGWLAPDNFVRTRGNRCGMIAIWSKSYITDAQAKRAKGLRR